MPLFKRSRYELIYPEPITAAESRAIKKLLVVRGDGLGDIVLTLPGLASLREQRPDIEVHILTSDMARGILELTNYVDNIIILPKNFLREYRLLPRYLIKQPNRFKNLANWYRVYYAFLAEIKPYNFDAALGMASRKPIVKLLKAAKIPHILGNYYALGGLIWHWQIPDPLYPTMYDMNEYDRTLGSLQWLGLKNTYVKPHINLDGISPPAIIQDWLSSDYAYIAMQPLKSKPSGLSWPIQNFIEITKQLLNEGWRIVLIGTKNEEAFVREAYQKLLHHSHLRAEFSMSMSELCVLINKASLFVGNSSGPLHLASLVDTPHVGINQLNFRYPFHRWKPLPQADQPNVDDYVLFPKLDYQCGECSQEACPHYSCLRYIEPLEVMQTIKQQLQRKTSLG